MHRSTIAEAPPYPNTEQLDRIEAELQIRLNGRIRELRLVRHDAGLILQGYCRTYYAKQLAQHAVMQASGLPIMANDIQVF